MKAKPVKKLDPAGPLGDNAARIVRTRLRELMDLSETALEPGELKAQHDLRIAAKRLRYVLELTGFCLGRPAETALRRCRELQDILGEMHDCDEMLPRVREHLAGLQVADAEAVRALAGPAEDLDPRLAIKAPHRPDYHGLEVLAVHLGARRRLMYDRFAAFWARQVELGTWARLGKAAEAQLERSRQARRAAKAARKAAAEEAEEAARASRAAAERATEAERATKAVAAENDAGEEPLPG